MVKSLYSPNHNIYWNLQIQQGVPELWDSTESIYSSGSPDLPYSSESQESPISLKLPDSLELPT